MDLKKLFLDMARLLIRSAFFELKWNFRPLGQPPYGIHKADVFVVLDEREDVAPLVAAEAVENLPLRVDIKARRFFLVKRTERNPVRPGALQRNIRAHDVNDVAGGANLFEFVLRDQSGHPGHQRRNQTARLGQIRLGLFELFAFGERRFDKQESQIGFDLRTDE